MKYVTAKDNYLENGVATSSNQLTVVCIFCTFNQTQPEALNFPNICEKLFRSLLFFIMVTICHVEAVTADFSLVLV